MKILTGNFHFELPDDFEGSRADAIRLLADYEDRPDPDDAVTIPIDAAEPPDETSRKWKQFIARGGGPPVLREPRAPGVRRQRLDRTPEDEGLT